MMIHVSTAPLAAFSVKAPEGPAWEFFVLFLVVICGPPLVQRARVPGIIGLLLGGFVIGPHGLDLITKGNTTVPELGKVGLLYLMFVAGVELDLALLRVHRRAAVGFGVLTFAFPMVFGTGVGFALGFGVAAALLLGSLLASHTLVLYPLVRDKGLASDPAIASAVGATVLTDTLALIVLAGVAGSNTQSGSTATIALQIVVGLAVLLVFTLGVLPYLVRWAFRKVASNASVRYLVVFASFLAAATLADMCGLEGLIGAFFAGLALNRFVPNRGPLMRRIDFFGSTVFIPIFLVSVGLLLDPRVMIQVETLKYAALFTVACLGGKAVAAFLTRPLMGYSGPQAGVVFALSSPQAAATLASTIVGFEIGLFGEATVNAVLVLILISVVVSTLAAERASARVARPGGEQQQLGEHVLVAIQDPDHAAFAVAVAGRIAEHDGGVVQGLLMCRHSQARPDDAQLAKFAAAGFAVGLDIDPRVVVDRSLADGVVNAAAASLASLVLVVEGDDPVPPALGGWAEAVAAAAPAPVILVRGSAPSFAHVHVPRAPNGAATPGGPAAALTAELARRLGGSRVEVRDADTVPAPGDVAIITVGSWERLSATAAPDHGAALLVPPPAVLIDTLLQQRSETSVEVRPA